MKSINDIKWSNQTPTKTFKKLVDDEFNKIRDIDADKYKDATKAKFKDFVIKNKDELKNKYRYIIDETKSNISENNKSKKKLDIIISNNSNIKASLKDKKAFKNKINQNNFDVIAEINSKFGIDIKPLQAYSKFIKENIK